MLMVIYSDIESDICLYNAPYLSSHALYFTLPLLKNSFIIYINFGHGLTLL